ncbi:MAG TPA: hypothetical protein VM346_04105 [Sphingomicrobium sp.]|nr:hypothetical protein [Sphingomicrobium sp.]
MARNNQRGRNNNNPSGYNQYNSGWTGTAREHPFAAAAAVGGAVAAGVFLWSRRNQISDLSEQMGEWRETMFSGSERDQFEMAGGGGDSFASTSGSTGSSGGTGTSSLKGSSGSSRGRSGKSTTGGSSGSSAIGGMSETGGGNASLGSQTGGGGMSTAPSGRGRS